MAFEKLRRKMKLLLIISLLVVSIHSHWVDEQLFSVIQPQNDDLWGTLQNLRNFSIPNFSGCEHTKACFLDLLTSTGFSTTPIPAYADYLNKMNAKYATGESLKNYCGTFDAVSHCFNQELDSCRTPTVFAALYDMTNDEAYRYTADLDLRKSMCDNQKELSDPCLNKITPMKSTKPIENDAAASCDAIAADLLTSKKANIDAGCSDAVIAAKCQVDTKTKEIESIGVCDGKLELCTENKACEHIKASFNDFYKSLDKAGVPSPLTNPTYSTFAANMKKKYENAGNIVSMCRIQSQLHASLTRWIEKMKNCPINAATFRSMYGMNYEQAYDYSTDYELRVQQCIHQDGILNQGTCMTPAKVLLNVCQPEIPHTLSQGKACTDLRLAMKCSNFAVRQTCPVETRQMYCVTQGLIFQQNALGFCDGWMPDCGPEPLIVNTKTPPPTTVTTTIPTVPTVPTTVPTVPTTTVMITSSTSLPPTTTSFASLSLPFFSALLVTLRLTL